MSLDAIGLVRKFFCEKNSRYMFKRRHKQEWS
ncbi:BnaCnng31960D [Brassica napus]|uniref:BnaCnng31960D protein n=1 Tax=Brassica napus TaxID=3708 RepID=A0A078J418_BRANA|nr:BnaCnng31960D [Brassica napus]